MCKKTKPMPGDFVIVTKSTDTNIKPGAYGVIEGKVGKHCKDVCSVRFNPDTPLMNNYDVISSGGPVYLIKPYKLIPTGKTIIRQFWKWKGLPQADGKSTTYEKEVNLFEVELPLL